MELYQTHYDCESVKMKTIGLIGGISYQSTIDYYRVINDTVNNAAGGHHFAKCIIYSLDLEPVLYLQEKGEWDELAVKVSEAARNLELAGAEIIAICSNTTNKVAEYVQNSIDRPVLHIIDAVGSKIKEQGLKRVALLGTKFTMEQSFYIEKLHNFGLEVLIPNQEDRNTVHSIIYNELDYGIINDESRRQYREIISRLADTGAEGVILGCTEIPLLIKQKDCDIPVFDTTFIHAEAIAELALK